MYPPGFDRFKQWPVLREYVVRRRLAFYLTPRAGGLHCGRFRTFEEARAWLPKSTGFDNAAISDEYIQDRTKRVFAFDYPVMFWLREAFEGGATSVLDIGGSVGSHYYAYRRYVNLPQGVRWRVSELPVVCRLGDELAKKQGVDAIEFTDSLDDLRAQEDIWMAAGVLEFLEDVRLEHLLARALRKPRHVLVNKLPLYDGEPFVSTHNLGNGSFAPHHVFNRKQFVTAVEALGYELADSWSVPERAYQDPLNPDRDFEEYSGLYFRQR